VAFEPSTVRASVADQGITVVLDPLGGVYLSSVLDASKLMARVVSRSLLLPKLWRGSPVERYRGKLLLNTHRS